MRVHYILDFIIEEDGSQNETNDYIQYLLRTGAIDELNIFRKEWKKVSGS